MSNGVFDEEKSLLEAIKGSVGRYTLEAHISHRIYPYTSYILKNVTATRFDGRKLAVPSISDERVAENTAEEFDFSSTDFKDIGFILKEIENPNSMKMDAHTFAISLPRILRRESYTMNFILVGTLAAFAVTHGVWLLALKFICAESFKDDMTIALKRVEGLFISLRRNLGKGDSEYYPEFYLYISLLSSSVIRTPSDGWESMGSLDSLIKAMLEVISVAHLFLKDVYEFITQSLKDDFDSLMILSIYWVTRGVLACSSECHKLPQNGYVIQDQQKLENIHEKLVSVLDRLRKLDINAKLYMDDEKMASAYQIPDKEGRDNYYALMALFGLQPNESENVKLSHCSIKNMDASLVSLRRKTLALIISGLNISLNVIDFLNEIYASLNQAECEFIWFPIFKGSWTTSMEEKYAKLRQMMSWYTVMHPTFLTEKTRQFIRDIWKFHRKPIVVVFNADGSVVCPNAIHLMYIWRAKGFPYSRMIVRTLWNNENTLDSLILGFDTHILSMLDTSKWVILYGGRNLGWCQKFVSCVRRISADSGISMEIIYAGKNVESENDREIISSILQNTQQNDSLDLEEIWYFWTRLESILISRCQTLNASVYSTDPFIRELQQLLSYALADSWACLIPPSSGGMMIHGIGDLMLQVFMDYDLWKQHLQTKDFTKNLYMYAEQLRERQMSDYPCNRIILNIDNKDVVESLTCSHCLSSMEKKIQYRCCHIDEQL